LDRESDNMNRYNVYVAEQVIDEYSKLTEYQQRIFYEFFKSLETGVPNVARKLKFNSNSYRVQVLTYMVVINKEKNNIEVKGIYKHPQADFYEYEGKAIEALNMLLKEKDYIPHINHVIELDKKRKIEVDAFYSAAGNEEKTKQIVVEVKKDIRRKLFHIVNQLKVIKAKFKNAITIVVIPPEEYNEEVNNLFKDNEIIVCTYDIRENIIQANEVIKRIG
jgi:mRNA-degrading endonuclease RelE of RelBE toxin-antitoxin system